MTSITSTTDDYLCKTTGTVEKTGAGWDSSFLAPRYNPHVIKKYLVFRPMWPTSTLIMLCMVVLMDAVPSWVEKRSAPHRFLPVLCWLIEISLSAKQNYILNTTFQIFSDSKSTLCPIRVSKLGAYSGTQNIIDYQSTCGKYPRF